MSHTHDDERTRSIEQALYLRDLYRWALVPQPREPKPPPAPPEPASDEA